MASRKKITVSVLANGFVIDEAGVVSSPFYPKVITTFEALATELWSLLGDAHRVGDKADLVVTRDKTTMPADKVRRPG